MDVLLVDDHPLYRLGLRGLVLKLWPDARVAEAETMEQTERQLAQQRMDLIVLDLTLPDASGTEAPARVMELSKGSPVLIATASPESAFASRLLQLGVKGFIAKDRAPEDFMDAMRRVASGGRYVTPELASRLVTRLMGKAASRLPHEALSPQEHRIMLLIAAGKGPTEIAEILSLSIKTVGTYRARIMVKGEWQNSTELTKYCLLHKLTDPK